MHDVVLTHGDVFAASRSFHMVTSVNAIVAAKLGKIRKAIVTKREPLAEGFDAIAQKYAKRDEKGAPVRDIRPGLTPPPTPQQPDPKPGPDEPQYFKLSGTPCYVFEDESPEERKRFDEEIDQFTNEICKLSVPELTREEFAQIVCAGQMGQALPIPPAIADVLHNFAPAL